jgi:ABC-2 type transport system permease protein
MLQTAWTISRHELRRIITDRAIVVFGLVLPIVIIVLVGLTFGGIGKVELGVRDLDGSARSQALIARLDRLSSVELKVYGSESTMRRDVRTTDTQAGIVIPAGYGDDLDAGAAEVEVIVDPSSEGAFSALATIDSAVTQEGVHEGAVRVVARDSGVSGAAARRAVSDVEEELEPVKVRDVRHIGRAETGGTFSYTAPANLVLFVFINTFAVSAVLANDRKAGLIRRMLATPNRPGGVLLGIGVSKLLFAITQSTLIVTIGAVAFGVRWGDPVAAAALVVVFAALATAVGLLVGSTVSDAEQAQAIGIPLAVALGMTGGCMWPLSIVPSAMRIAGHLGPHAWAMDAWQELIYDRAGLAGNLPNLLVLAGGTAVIGVLAVSRLRRSVLG